VRTSLSRSEHLLKRSAAATKKNGSVAQSVGDNVGQNHANRAALRREKESLSV